VLGSFWEDDAPFAVRTSLVERVTEPRVGRAVHLPEPGASEYRQLTCGFASKQTQSRDLAAAPERVLVVAAAIGFQAWDKVERENCLQLITSLFPLENCFSSIVKLFGFTGISRIALSSVTRCTAGTNFFRA
jgi:hypothetical protein